jgi:hypothetical protein
VKAGDIRSIQNCKSGVKALMGADFQFIWENGGLAGNQNKKKAEFTVSVPSAIPMKTHTFIYFASDVPGKFYGAEEGVWVSDLKGSTNTR